jgi:hypothetical protein
MTTQKTTTEPAPFPPDWPNGWFAELVRALEAGDLKRAGNAQSNLERLGFKVQPIKTGGAA